MGCGPSVHAAAELQPGESPWLASSTALAFAKKNLPPATTGARSLLDSDSGSRTSGPRRAAWQRQQAATAGKVQAAAHGRDDGLEAAHAAGGARLGLCSTSPAAAELPVKDFSTNSIAGRKTPPPAPPEARRIIVTPREATTSSLALGGMLSGLMSASELPSCASVDSNAIGYVVSAVGMDGPPDGDGGAGLPAAQQVALAAAGQHGRGGRGARSNAADVFNRGRRQAGNGASSDATAAASSSAAADPAAAGAETASASWVLRRTAPLESVYELGKVLGQGSFGVVRVVTHRTTGTRSACKTISKDLLGPKDVACLRHEVEILHHLAGHPHISQLEGVYEDATGLHLVIELCQGGDLFDAIIATGRHSERAAADVLRAVLTSIGYCHAMNVCHRDIKPENFMLAGAGKYPAGGDDDEAAGAAAEVGAGGSGSTKGGAAAAPGAGVGDNLKLIDFGLSVFCSADQQMTQVVGTSYYVAPEVLERRYTRAVDVWSAGVILHIMLAGCAPFDGRNDEQILKSVRTKELDLTTDPVWQSISPEAVRVVRAMLDRNPSTRATADQLLAMPWLGRSAAACTASTKPLPGVVSERLQRFAAMNSFKKEARKVVAGLLPEEQVAGLVAQFKMLDADGDGRLTVQELKAALERQQRSGLGGIVVASPRAAAAGGAGAPATAAAMRPGVGQVDVRAVMDSSDLNGDGVLDASEWLGAALPAVVLARQPDRTLAAAFAHFDTDGSGYITVDELRAALKGHRHDLDVQRLLDEVDADQDGRINYQEFCEMLQRDDDASSGGGRAGGGGPARAVRGSRLGASGGLPVGARQQRRHSTSVIVGQPPIIIRAGERRKSVGAAEVPPAVAVAAAAAAGGAAVISAALAAGHGAAGRRSPISPSPAVAGWLGQQPGQAAAAHAGAVGACKSAAAAAATASATGNAAASGRTSALACATAATTSGARDAPNALQPTHSPTYASDPSNSGKADQSAHGRYSAVAAAAAAPGPEHSSGPSALSCAQHQHLASPGSRCASLSAVAVPPRFRIDAVLVHPSVADSGRASPFAAAHSTGKATAPGGPTVVHEIQYDSTARTDCELDEVVSLTGAAVPEVSGWLEPSPCSGRPFKPPAVAAVAACTVRNRRQSTGDPSVPLEGAVDRSAGGAADSGGGHRRSQARRSAEYNTRLLLSPRSHAHAHARSDDDTNGVVGGQGSPHGEGMMDDYNVLLPPGAADYSHLNHPASPHSPSCPSPAGGRGRLHKQSQHQEHGTTALLEDEAAAAAGFCRGGEAASVPLPLVIAVAGGGGGFSTALRPGGSRMGAWGEPGMEGADQIHRGALGQQSAVRGAASKVSARLSTPQHL